MKDYYTMDNVGSAKYTVNSHDDSTTHNDGSPFYDIKIFDSKVSRDSYIKGLERQGYVVKTITGVKINIVDITLPANYLCALINDDRSGLSDIEAQDLDEWIDIRGGEYDGFICVGVVLFGDSYFSHSNAMNALGGDVIDFRFQVDFN